MNFFRVTLRRAQDHLSLLALAAGLAAATALAGAWMAPLQDALGYLTPAPELPVAVVEVTGSPREAADAALLAGARSTRMALPTGHPLLEGAPSEDRALRADSAGRLRWDGDLRLPLPEGLDGLVRLDEAQLAPGGPGGLLSGRDVVLTFKDPALGLSASVPGRVTPARRGEVLAVALGAARVGGLRTLPLPLAAGLVALLTLLSGAYARRRPPVQALMSALPHVLVVFIVATLARTWGWLLPVGGMAGAVLLPNALRFLRTSAQALDVLDRISLRLGGVGRRGDARSPLDQLVDATALYAPGHSVAAWRTDKDWQLEEVARVEGPHTFKLPDRAPARTQVLRGQLLTPIVDAGEIVGALGLAGPAADSPETRPWLEALAQLRPGVGLRHEAHPDDPFDLRMQLVYRGVGHAIDRARARELLEREETVFMGVFSLAGALIVGTGPLRERLQGAEGLPLISALETLAKVPPDVVRQIVRDRASTTEPLRVQGSLEDTDVLITPLTERGAPAALLVQLIPAQRVVRESKPAQVIVIPPQSTRRASQR
ncbi:MAG: hypothetical protein H6740_12275 [Alphaproteobacteria bacterium]|nr:hypothetical protein [Alphaproteobacteria bacterium]